MSHRALRTNTKINQETPRGRKYEVVGGFLGRKLRRGKGGVQYCQVCGGNERADVFLVDDSWLHGASVLPPIL
ncbi:hypothetical protein PanWU01x14_107280 [Parasponia andersonii]|uniref:Uncharacterized protein n=1 Tax=Parasponia andersonii TaxID=3476 RepID=A0A2P5D084_PARAD|nr:hypothetical protein PanWU01x14_107280 [Parasponia andersonii]